MASPWGPEWRGPERVGLLRLEPERLEPEQLGLLRRGLLRLGLLRRGLRDGWRAWHAHRMPLPRRASSLAVYGRPAVRRSTTPTGRTHPFPGAWLARSCCRPRAPWRARRPGPLPRLSCLGPSQGRHADRRYGCAVLIGARSSGAHQRSTRSQLDGSGVDGTTSATKLRTGAGSSGPPRRSARVNARRRSASSRQLGTGCNHAPRPSHRWRGSGTTHQTPSTSAATTRSRTDRSSRSRHPTHVRMGLRGGLSARADIGTG
jgi:hypothetical protein